MPVEIGWGLPNKREVPVFKSRQQNITYNEMNNQDLTHETELPYWMYSMYFQISRAEQVPIFLDAREQGLIPVKEYWFEEDENELLLEYDELAKRQLQVFFLHEELGERQADYPHK